MATALTTLLSLPSVSLAPHPTPIDRLARLETALGDASPQLFMKRDDLLSFGLGGNKVRKMQAVAADALAAGADTLITCGGVQSNHARVTAAAGAALGLPVELVLNGTAPSTELSRATHAASAAPDRTAPNSALTPPTGSNTTPPVGANLSTSEFAACSVKVPSGPR